MSTFRRKTPEELLQMITKLKQGRLKVYIGAVSGSGKTYHMLRDGQMLRHEGIDVVICAVSTLQRPETMQQLGDLERIPSIHWIKEDKQGQTWEQKDLNLEKIIERNPEVVLVDHLAHMNRPEAQHRTRWEDIRYLLEHGISVMVTVNVYELEGSAQLAQQYIGREVECTVPSDTLHQADEVRLIDVTPEVILQRYSAGLLDNSSDRAFFERGNLAVLRELALRTVAEGVGGTLEKHRAEQGLTGPTGTAERIMVSVQYHWNGSIYIRRGQQIARRLSGDLLVVSFQNKARKLNREEETFKRSIRELSTQVGGVFEEVAMISKRRLPRQVVRYAKEHQVTRIVMGHSRQNRWQEWINRSVINGVLLMTRDIDIFLMADRAEQEGERILPAKTTKLPAIKKEDSYRRLPSEEIARQIDHIRRGTFKVYVGAAPGVGKTYTMLREGNELRRQGIDVVIGLLETHGRQETADQAASLPLLSRQIIKYGDHHLEELDVEQIIARNPEVVLVDELAHTNVPGSRNSKRYEDITELLAAGISVISTVNIQHLESLNDAVEQITGIRVRETVPDSILHLADEVELIDVTPQTLRQRLQEGKIYASSKVEQALSNFFKMGNLIALRELALREVADDVDERLESWERKDSLRGPWQREEIIFVGVKLDHEAERLIRRGFRIAYRLKAKLIVSYIHIGSEFSLAGAIADKADKLHHLTVRLGGEFEIQYQPLRQRLAQSIVEEAQSHHATQMILGQTSTPPWKRWGRDSLLKKVLRHARNMDILVVADRES
ncbi:two-component system sensor histidine kinase KdpD [Paenibacillus sp. SORGH_AS306]|uniref:histidine kinase n=1 Tax=unclassified Paenibacillus TaxID=185978 RepID=UPI002787727F|nr:MULTISPECIES: histidine kinase [unclassified Paenibacillus]MDQ1233976.1 two-component system sensor histidine kinase KdpD [Paenibacillus sp. SORGH_AS_0306]MDR6111021.1 two-component system sensor histidine kinase KdpD [Paenibacillus sp. SORGH_AS_0338]